MNRKYKNGWKSILPYCGECGKRLSTKTAKLCRKCYNATMVGEGNPFYGKHHTDEWKDKIHIPRKAYKPSQETRDKISRYNILSCTRPPVFCGEDHPNWKGGKPKCVDCGKNLSSREVNGYQPQRCKSCSKKGMRTHLWKGGITPLARMIRGLLEMKKWKIQVFNRDNYTCQECGIRGKKIEAHHKQEFSRIFECFLKECNPLSPIDDKDTLIKLAIKYKPFWDINNGKTLCKNCHNLTKSILNKEDKICQQDLVI